MELNSSVIIRFEIFAMAFRDLRETGPWPPRSIPGFRPSFYSRKDNGGKKYLREDLSVQRMYNLYLEENESEVWERQQDILR